MIKIGNEAAWELWCKVRDSGTASPVLEFASELQAEVLRLNGGGGEAGEWTVIAPDGKRFTGPTPLKAAIPASQYRIEIDPVAQAKFLQAIEQIRQDGEEEREQCIRDYGTLNCPHCGGSGHIADAVANGHAPQPQQAAPELLSEEFERGRRAGITQVYDSMQQQAAPGAVQEGWQPIETAPKDGTEILGWRDDCGALIVSFRSPSTMPLTQEELDVTDEETLFQEDWFTQWPAAERLEGGDTPTHWLPLPAAPSAPKPQGE